MCGGDRATIGIFFSRVDHDSLYCNLDRKHYDSSYLSHTATFAKALSMIQMLNAVFRRFLSFFLADKICNVVVVNLYLFIVPYSS